jgi:hypothetical protein
MSFMVPNTPTFWESGVDGPSPAVWFGTEAPRGADYPYLQAPPGSLYVRTGTQPQLWMKYNAAGVASDWASVGSMFSIVERVTFNQFTDGGAAIGTLDLAQKIPAGAWVARVLVVDTVGFAGNVSAVLDVGTSTDDDRYNATAGFNVFANSAALDGGTPSGTQVHTAETTVRLTLTADSDFTAVSAGACTVKIFFYY